MMQGDDKINQQDTPSTEPSPQGSSVQRNLSHYLLKLWSTPGLLVVGLLVLMAGSVLFRLDGMVGIVPFIIGLSLLGMVLARALILLILAAFVLVPYIMARGFQRLFCQVCRRPLPAISRTHILTAAVCVILLSLWTFGVLWDRGRTLPWQPLLLLLTALWAGSVCWLQIPRRYRRGIEIAVFGCPFEAVSLPHFILPFFGLVLVVSFIPPNILDNRTQAHRMYTAEAVPVIGHLRTKTELHRYERDHLPGMMQDTNAVPVETAPRGMSPEGGTSHLGTGFLTQTFKPVKDSDDVHRYEPSMLNVVTNLGVHPGHAEIAERETASHYSRQLHIGYEDLTGRRLRPPHIMYWSPAAGYRSEVYAYAFGAFGDGVCVPAGTGYAVLEIHNSALQQKHVMTWERWRPVTKDAAQIVFVSPDENPAADPATAREENYCWVPSKAAITTDDPEVFEAMLKDLRKAGWR
jgi:hypothetical protein